MLGINRKVIRLTPFLVVERFYIKNYKIFSKLRFKLTYKSFLKLTQLITNRFNLKL